MPEYFYPDAKGELSQISGQTTLILTLCPDRGSTHIPNLLKNYPTKLHEIKTTLSALLTPALIGVILKVYAVTCGD